MHWQHTVLVPITDHSIYLMSVCEPRQVLTLDPVNSAVYGNLLHCCFERLSFGSCVFHQVLR